jgi:hypothetical protein
MDDIFDNFKACKYEDVLKSLEELRESVERNEGDEENEGFARQERMAEILVEYYKEGAKDPKKAYKALSDIENEYKNEPFSETNFLLEYN